MNCKEMISCIFFYLFIAPSPKYPQQENNSNRWRQVNRHFLYVNEDSSTLRLLDNRYPRNGDDNHHQNENPDR